MNNPIIKNRLVSDKTFALRLLNFIKNVDTADLPSTEEKQYLIRVAENLIKWQKRTACDQEEIEYLRNNNII